MAGAVDVEMRGAIEVGERDGGSAASRFGRGAGRGRGQGRGMGPCGFSQGDGGGRGGATTVRSRGEGLIAGRAAPYPSSFECPAFMMKKLCL